MVEGQNFIRCINNNVGVIFFQNIFVFFDGYFFKENSNFYVVYVFVEFFIFFVDLERV